VTAHDDDPDTEWTACKRLLKRGLWRYAEVWLIAYAWKSVADEVGVHVILSGCGDGSRAGQLLFNMTGMQGVGDGSCGYFCEVHSVTMWNAEEWESAEETTLKKLIMSGCRVQPYHRYQMDEVVG